MVNGRAVIGTQELCGERWHGGNGAVTCQKERHPDSEWHESTVTKTEQIDYGLAKITSTVTEVVTWEGLGAALHRTLDRAKQRDST